MITQFLTNSVNQYVNYQNEPKPCISTSR